MKRSASDTSESPPDVQFVLDETLSGKSIIAGLQERGIDVHPFLDFFTRGMDDQDLLDTASKHPGLCLVTRDRDFRYKPDVAAEVIRKRAGVFVLTASGNRTGAQLDAILAAAWPHIVRTARKTRRPFVATIRSDGTVAIWRTAD